MNSESKDSNTFSMMFPSVEGALDVPEDKISDFFDDFIVMNWQDGDVGEFIDKYKDGMRPMTENEKQSFRSKE